MEYMLKTSGIWEGELSIDVDGNGEKPLLESNKDFNILKNIECINEIKINLKEVKSIENFELSVEVVRSK